MYICKYCGKEFETSRKLGGHTSHCSLNPKYKNTLDKINNTRKTNIDINNPFEEHICQCQYCGNDYRVNIRHNSFIKGLYPKTCSSECSHKLSTQNTDWDKTKKNISESLKGCVSFFKGKIKVNGQWVNDPNWKPYHVCPICNKEFIGKTIYCGKECSNIGRSKNLSKSLKNNPKVGGIRPNAYKKYKSGLYHGIHCDSSWELAFIIYCEDHNIKVERNKEYLTYIFENKEYKYYPDFIINNQLYEIKGYENDKAKVKHQQHPEVIYLDKNKMKLYIDYVIDKYGNDYIKLYDKLDKQYK